MASKYVLDTHSLVWYLEGNPRLSPAAKAIVDDSNNQLILPLIALAEAAFLVERGRIAIPSIPDLLSDVQADPSIEVYPLTWGIFQHTLTATSIPEMHDRLIVATALYLPEAYYNRGLAYKQKGDATEAVTDFRKALQLTNDPKLHQQAQDQLKALGKQ
jgi:PIN domain nuclease of toxin-antitoxin system